MSVRIETDLQDLDLEAGVVRLVGVRFDADGAGVHVATRARA